MKKTVVLGIGLFDKKLKEKATHNITHINVNVLDSMITLTVEEGTAVKRINLSTQLAEDIGFLNVEKIKDLL